MQAIGDSRPIGVTDNACICTTLAQSGSRSRPRSSKYWRRKAELNYCSSPDSAVVTGSDSLGSTESINSLDVIENGVSKTRPIADPRRRSGRCHRRWCQVKRDSLDSCLSTESGTPSTLRSMPNNTITDILKVALRTHNLVGPVAVVRNTLDCPVIFPPGSYPPNQTGHLSFFMPYFPVSSPHHWMSLPVLTPYDVPYPPSGSVTIDITGHDVSFSVENLPPLSPKHSQHAKEAPPLRPLMEIDTKPFQSYAMPVPPSHLPYVCIPAPLRLPRALDHCRSLKTCAVPFSEFPHCKPPSPTGSPAF